MTPREIPGVFAIAVATPGAFAGEHIATPPRTSAAMFAAMPTRETPWPRTSAAMFAAMPTRETP